MTKSTLDTRLNWTKDVESFEKRLNINAYNKSMRSTDNSKQASERLPAKVAAHSTGKKSISVVQDYTSGSSAYFQQINQQQQQQVRA